MIRSTTSCRQFLIRRWNPAVVASETTTTTTSTSTPTPTPTPTPSSSMSRARREPGSKAAATPAASRGFHHLARQETAATHQYQQQQHQQQQHQQHRFRESQPRAGLTPSQHFRYQDSLQNRNSGAGQIRTVFVQTENTPNPESIKFLPSNTVRACVRASECGVVKANRSKSRQINPSRVLDPPDPFHEDISFVRCVVYFGLKPRARCCSHTAY